jgi:hypothetical protein
MTYDLEAELLRAAHELSVRRDELHRLIGAAVGREPYEHWLDNRRRGAADIEHHGDWSWVTLALGFDVLHVDGRRVTRSHRSRWRRLTTSSDMRVHPGRHFRGLRIRCSRT